MMNVNQMIVPQIVLPSEGQPEERLKAYLLATLECPFFGECEFDGCPFAHRAPPTENSRNETHPIPWFYCMDHLLHQCESVRAQPLGSQLVRCHFGFHPSNEDLADGSLFKARLASAFLSGQSIPQIQSWTLANCAICNTTIEGNCFIQENCSHRFCIRCCNREFDSFRVLLTNDIVCGICKTTSKRLMYWQNKAISNSYRRVIFSLQRRAFGLMIGPASQVLMSNDEKDGQMVIRYQKIGRIMARVYRLEVRQESQESPTSPQANNTNEQCDICLKAIAATPERLWAYLENCSHRFCLRCLLEWRAIKAPMDPFTGLRSIDFSCPTCRSKAARILIWPDALDNAYFRQFLFSVQKLSSGLSVSSQLTISAHEVSPSFEDLVFICNSTVWVPEYAIGRFVPGLNSNN